MKPVLFYDNSSPPVRSCLMLIKTLAIDVELKFVNLQQGEHMRPDFIKINPIHTVPVLQHGDLTLTDSHAILIYLCEQFGKNTDLYPTDHILRIKVINRLFFESSILFRRDSQMMGEIFRGEFRDLDRNKEQVGEAYSMMEAFLGENKFMACGHITIADLSIVTTMTTVSMVVPVEKAKWPRLVEWYQEMKSFPVFEEINSPGCKRLKMLFENIPKFIMNE